MTEDEKINLLRTSILKLKQVRAVYDGYPRELCFHVLGTKKGLWKAFAWQFGGTSSKPETLPSWRDLFVSRLDDIILQDGEWHRGWTSGQRDQMAVELIDTVVDQDYAAEVKSISKLHIPTLDARRRARRK